MEVETDKLVPIAMKLDDWYTDADMDSLMTSIQECGILDPIVVNNHGEILDGLKRWIAASRLGIKVVPVDVAEDNDLGEQEDEAAFFNMEDEI